MNALWSAAGPRQRNISWLVALGMIIVIGTALGFEHIGGYAPCALCLEQRNPYYWGIPIILVGAVAASLKWPACLIRGALLIALFCLVATAMIGAYHAGAEWGFWPGPESCGAGTTATSSDAGSLLNDLSKTVSPSCTDAAGRFLGISFAGWNVIAASVLAFVAARGVLSKA